MKGEVEKQIGFLTKALQIKEAHYGQNHLEIAITASSLGNAYRTLHKYELAEIFYRKALHIYEANEKQYFIRFN